MTQILADETLLAEVEYAFERAANAYGDITPKVLSRFYESYPNGRELFSSNAGGQLSLLEGNMVEETAFFLLGFCEGSQEAETILTQSVPHHIQTLKVPMDAMTAFIDAFLFVVASKVDTSEPAAAALSQLRSALDPYLR